MFGTAVSDLQQNIVVSEDNKITGTLKYYDDPSSALVTRWGAGNFLAVQLDADWDEYTSVLVGLDPSAGSGLQELIEDPDKSGVFKITDKDEQLFVTVCKNGKITTTTRYDLSGLTCLSE